MDIQESAECPDLEMVGDYCGVVQMCAPCIKGFFSPQINYMCMNCPIGSGSEMASFGIRQCTCPEGQYIENYKYSMSPFIPPEDPEASKLMECIDCPDGGVCSLDDLSVYPYPDEGYWQSQYQYEFKTTRFRGVSMLVPVDLGPRDIYECPYDSCEGGLHSNCSEGYEGHVCGICASDYRPTAEGCEICEGIGDNIFMLLVLLAIFAPIGILMSLFGMYVLGAMAKLGLCREIKRVFAGMDVKSKGVISKKELQTVYESMSPEEKELVCVTELGAATLADFFDVVLFNMSPLDIGPDDVTDAMERLACWDNAQQQIEEERVQNPIAKALGHYQNACINADLASDAIEEQAEQDAGDAGDAGGGEEEEEEEEEEEDADE